MRIPAELIPTCPDDGSKVTTNLRADDSFVEDAGWQAAAARYDRFVEAHQTGRILYLELGVGANTPVIIKFPFGKMTMANPDALPASIMARPTVRNRSKSKPSAFREILVKRFT